MFGEISSFITILLFFLGRLNPTDSESLQVPCRLFVQYLYQSLSRNGITTFNTVMNVILSAILHSYHLITTYCRSTDRAEWICSLGSGRHTGPPCQSTGRTDPCGTRRTLLHSQWWAGMTIVTEQWSPASPAVPHGTGFRKRRLMWLMVRQKSFFDSF